MRVVSVLAVLALLVGSGVPGHCRGPEVLLAADAPAGAPGASPTLSPVDAACELVYSTVLPTPGTIVERFGGVLGGEPVPLDAAGSKAARPDAAGWTLVISGSWEELGDAPSPDGAIFELLTGKGWLELPEHSADGPDGTRFALSSGGVICSVWGRWDGGDDTDSTYVASDVYQVIVRLMPSE